MAPRVAQLAPAVRVSEGGRTSTWAVVAVVAAFAALVTFPQAAAWTSVPGHHDALFSMWRLAWIAHQLPRNPAGLFDANNFFPTTRTLALSDATLLQGVLAAPWIWLGVPVVVVYNALVLGSFVASALAMYLLVVTLTGSRAGGVVAGAVYGFAPFRFEHYMHLEMLWAPWVPLAFWALHRALASGRLRDGLLVGIFCAAQTFSAIYYGVFLATALIPLCLALLLGMPWSIARSRIAPLAAGVLVWAALAAPYMAPYARNAEEVGTRSPIEVARYSASLADFAVAPGQNRLYGARSGLAGGERRLMPGLLAFAAAAIGLLAGACRPHRVAYGVLTLAAADWTMGLAGVTYPLLHEHIGVFAGLRVPARAWMIGLAGLATLSGFGAAALSRKVGPTAAALVLAGLSVEYANHPLVLRPVQTAPRPFDTWLAEQPPTVLLELPLPDDDALPGHEAEVQYASTFHWQRLLNGYSGFYPEPYLRMLATFERFPHGHWRELLADRGVGLIIVHERWYPPAELEGALSALERTPALTRVARFPDVRDPVVVFAARGTEDAISRAAANLLLPLPSDGAAASPE